MARGVQKHSDCRGDRVFPRPPSPSPLPVNGGGTRWSLWGAWPPCPLPPCANLAARGSGSEARPPSSEPGPAPTVWPWPKSPNFSAAWSPRLRAESKSGRRGHARRSGLCHSHRHRHRCLPFPPFGTAGPAPRPCRFCSCGRHPNSPGTREGPPPPLACATCGRRSDGVCRAAGGRPRTQVCRRV